MVAKWDDPPSSNNPHSEGLATSHFSVGFVLPKVLGVLMPFFGWNLHQHLPQGQMLFRVEVSPTIKLHRGGSNLKGIYR